MSQEDHVMLNGLTTQGALRRVASDRAASLWEASRPATGRFAGVESSSSLNHQPAQSDKRDGLARIASAFASSARRGPRRG